MVRSLREHRPDLTTLTDAALLARARSMAPLLQQTFENAMRVSSMASLGPGALGAVCEALGDPTLSIRLLAGIEVDSGSTVARDVGTRPPRCRLRRGRGGVRCRPRPGARHPAGIGLGRGPRLPRSLRHVPVRARRPRSERVRPVLDLVGGPSPHRPRGDRPHAPVRRVAGAGQPHQRVGRRARSDRRRDPRQGRRRSRDRRDCSRRRSSPPRCS